MFKVIKFIVGLFQRAKKNPITTAVSVVAGTVYYLEEAAIIPKGISHVVTPIAAILFGSVAADGSDEEEEL